MRVRQGPEDGGQGGAGARARLRLPIALLCPTGLHSPPLLGSTAVPGLVAPITNGFAGVVPFPGGHPALETVYANGLVPYPGNVSGSPRGRGEGVGPGRHLWDKRGFLCPGAWETEAVSAGQM